MICLKSLSSVMTSLLRDSPRAPATTTAAAKFHRPEGAPPFAFRAFGWGRTDEGAAMTVAGVILWWRCWPATVNPPPYAAVHRSPLPPCAHRATRSAAFAVVGDCPV